MERNEEAYGLQTYYDADLGKKLVIVAEDEYEVKPKRSPKTTAEPTKDYFKTRGNTGYVECYHDPIRRLNDKLKIHELGALLKLLPYMKRNKGGGLVKDGVLMGVSEIASVIKKAQRPTTRIIAALTAVGVLISDREGKRNVYGINPLYHSFAGGLEAGPYTKLYQTKTRISIDSVSLQAAGLLYKTLPYFHYSRYYLCANPNESSGGLIQHLTQNELARLIGEELSVVSTHMRELIRAGFVMRSEAFGNVVMRVNPEVMYRKRILDAEAERIIDEFSEHQNASNWRDGQTIDIDDLPF